MPNQNPEALDKFFGPGTADKLKASNKGGGFQIPNTLDQEEFPAGSEGQPFFSGGVTKTQKDLLGPAYQGNPNGHFQMLNWNKLNNLAIQSGIKSRDAAQKAWEEKYPLLAKADKAGITSSLLNISGKHDPFITDALNASGLGGTNMGAEGDLIGQSQAMGGGSSLGGLLALGNRARDYSRQTFENHPITRLGLGPKSVWDVASANTGGVNLAAANAAENATRLADAQQNASNQTTASIIGAFSQLAGTGIRAAGDANSPYLNPSTYQSQYVTGPMEG